jgi:hypothetical protein
MLSRLSFLLLAAACVSSAVNAQPAPPPARATPAAQAQATLPPTRDEKLGALAVLVRIYNSKPADSKLRLGVAVAATLVLYELAGVDVPSEPVATNPEVDVALRDLLSAWGVDAGPMLREVHAESCRKKQSEAKANLKAMYVAQESHRAEFDRYHTDMKALGFVARGTVYVYEVVAASGTAFSARAIGTGAMKGDLWEITETSELKQISSACSETTTTMTTK